MPTSTISWNELNPADPSVMSALDLRSNKTAIRVGLSQEHTWPSSSGSAGAHVLGSARAFFDVQSNVSSAGTDGLLFVTSDTSRFCHVGSGGTMFLGGQGALAVGGQPTGGQRFIWVEDIALAAGSAGTVGVSFSPSGFSGLPFVFVSAFTGDIRATDAHVAWSATPSGNAVSIQVRSLDFTNSAKPSLSTENVVVFSLGTQTL